MKKFIAPIIAIVISVISSAAMVIYVAPLSVGKVPTHFGIDMQPDRYGSKWAFVIPSVAVLSIVSVGFLVYRILTDKKENHRKNAKYEDVFICVIILLMGGLMWFMLLSALGKISPNRSWLPYVGIALGVLLTVFSNVMGKIKRQRNFGIKLYATINNETVWRRTHRLAGALGVIMSLLLIAGSVVTLIIKKWELPVFTACFIGYFVVAFIIPSIYAEVLYKKLGKDTEE